MGLFKSFFSQCAQPKGALGRVMLSFMNYTHAPLTNWGLKLVDLQDGWTMLDVGCGGFYYSQISPEELKTMLDDAGFIQTEIHRMKPSNATIIGVKA